MSRLRVACLPAVVVERGGRPVAGFRSVGERALLVYLGVEGDRPHQRVALAGLLWPDAPEPVARRNLTQTLLRLRAALGEAAAAPPVLLVTRQTLQWNPAAGAEVDVGVLLGHLEAAAAHPHPALAGCAACLRRLGVAVDLHRGPFLGEFAGPPSELFEEWAALKREWLQRRVAGALEQLAEAALERGEPAAAAGYARRELALEPLAEGAHRRLMRALFAGGDRGAALAQYAACRRLLAAELGAEPAPETAALAGRLLAGGPPAGAVDLAPPPAAPAATRRRGARTRRGGPVGRPGQRPSWRVDGARRVGDGAPARAPVGPAPLVLVPEAPAPPAPGHNLPAPLTALVGRERELAAVAGRLAETRLLTLTGPGGGGKTRLALALAARLAAAGEGGPGGPPYPDGVWLAELAALADPDLVAQAVAAAVGLREVPGLALTETLCRALRERRLLLVLDNCEHLLEACAALAAALLGAGPGVRVLATSRRPLGLPGEATWWVPPLAWPAGPAGEPLAPAALPPPAALLEYGAVRLFVERARDARPAFALTPVNAPAVVQVCARLDGLPLALELAARQVAVLPPGELAARLDARFRLLTGGGPAAHPHQRTLAATLDWSHALLGGAERALLRRLSVFAGGFTLEAAEAVGADGTNEGDEVHEGAGGAGGASRGGLPAEAVLEALRRLVDQSLVVAQGAPGADPDASADVARYRLLETVRQYAAERLAAAGDGEAEAVRARHAAWAAGLAAAAGPGLLGRDQLEWLVRLDAEQDNLRAALGWGLRRDPAAALRLAGRLWPYWRLRERPTEGRRWLAAALAGAPERTAAWARAALGAGILARDRNEPAAARAHLEASLDASRALGEPELTAWALRDLGTLHLRECEFGLADARAEESLAIARIAGDRRGAAAALLIRAHAAALGGDFGRARALGAESLAAAREAGDPWLLSTVLHRLAVTALDQGDLAAAGPALEEGLALARELGPPSRAAHIQLLQERVALARGESERARPLLEAFRAAAGEAEGPDAAWGRRAATLGELGRAALARGEPAEAARLLRESLRLRQGWGDRVGAAWCLEALAAAAAGAAPARAARLLGAAAAARRALGMPPQPYWRPDVAAAEGAARAALGAGAYAAARAAGAALSLEQAAAEALQEAPPGAA